MECGVATVDRAEFALEAVAILECVGGAGREGRHGGQKLPPRCWRCQRRH